MNNIEIQEIELDMIKCVDEIAKRHSISYMLGYGSMLGAIREQNIIPWDTDIDIIVNTDVYEDFCECLKRELPVIYDIVDPYKDSSYEFLFSRVILRGNSHEIIHIDIYREVGVSDSPNVQKGINIVFMALYWLYYIKKKPYKRERIHWGLLFAKMITIVIPSSLIRTCYRYMAVNFKVKDSNFVTNSNGSYGILEVIPTKWVTNIVKTKFGPIDAPISEHYHEYLTHFYKDYMTPKKENYVNK